MRKGMRAKAKGDVHIPAGGFTGSPAPPPGLHSDSVPAHPECETLERATNQHQMPHWEPKVSTKAFRTTSETKTEVYNEAYAEGATFRCLDEVIRKQNMLIGLAASVGLINLAIGILLIAHLSMTQ